ncbi:MAG: hypothetical protein EOO08_05470 [Chitinophagaceae bacterium]|nr:MAG: hypothetical protein EOO08_05470 [Chitinophagaceae bacterium]
MWHQLVENTKALETIYGGAPPSLDDVMLIEIALLHGGECRLRFDTTRLPHPLPAKWQQAEVNTVQIELLLTGATLHAAGPLGNFAQGSIVLEECNHERQLIFLSGGEKLFSIRATALLLTRVSGYSNGVD